MAGSRLTMPHVAAASRPMAPAERVIELSRPPAVTGATMVSMAFGTPSATAVYRFSAAAWDVMRDLAPESLVHAIEANGAEFVLALGRAGGGEERDDREINWTIGGSPIDYHNAVVRADLSPGAAAGAIRASIDRMLARGVPGTWHVGPSMRPADLPCRLLEHGFVCGGHDIGMAADLQELPDRVPAPGALSIVRVDDSEGLAAWTAT